jgi:type IV pilus assembly protein PilM
LFGDSNAIAIDIGSRFIKVIYGKRTKTDISVLGFGICSTPGDAYENGNITGKRELISAVSGIIEKGDYNTKNAIIGMKGSDIIIRRIEMPEVPEKQFKQAASMEIQQYLPMDSNEYVIDSKMIGRKNAADKKMLDILLVAAPKRKVEEYLYIVDKLDLKVKSVDIFANSVVKFFEKDSEYVKGNYDCIGMLDLGYRSSTITLIEQGKLFLEKEIDTGTRNINESIENTLGGRFDNIDKIQLKVLNLVAPKKDFGGMDPRIYECNVNAKKIIDNLMDEIVKVLNFYTSSGYNKNVGCIYLYGGGSRIAGIEEYINGSIGVETRLFGSESLEGIKNVNWKFKNNVQLYINCLSLLLRKE